MVWCNIIELEPSVATAVPTEIEMDVLETFSQIGVILILFSSGLETDIKEMKKSGFSATMIAIAGVVVPIALGTVVSLLFMGDGAFTDYNKIMNALFIGAILAATSVGITVETLRELGKLNTKLGTTVLSAAIIDDVIGIIALSIITSMHGGGNIGMTLLKSLGFFIFAIILAIPLRKFFAWLEETKPHKRRLGIYAVSLCFLFAFISEKFFGVAAITGAYVAGVILSGMSDTKYMDRKVLINGYMIFSPIFFAYIGISADFSKFTPAILLFSISIVIVGILGKIIGCGAVAKLCKFNTHDSLIVGSGMVARGEVALAVYSAGASLIYKSSNGAVLGIDPLFSTIMLIIITSIACPVLLKLLFKNRKNNDDNDDINPKEAEIEVPQSDYDGLHISETM